MRQFAPNPSVAQEYGYNPDRDSRQLTSGGPMWRPTPPWPEQDSIFGNTYGGVPNPFVLVRSGYPTRYHGPIFNVPQPGYRYRGRPYAKDPFWGFELGQGNRAAAVGVVAAAGAALGYFGAKRLGYDPTLGVIGGGVAGVALLFLDELRKKP